MIPSDDSKKKTQKDSGDIFSDSDIQEIVDLGNVLYDIHKRLISEGWKIDLKTGISISPDGVSYTKETTHLYHEEKEKKRKAELQAKRQSSNTRSLQN